tara:strand:+ start:145 stop:504 length:360 start_codon:yes stop_codon:yes gene_type:complete
MLRFGFKGSMRVEVKENKVFPIQKDGTYELSVFKKKRSLPQNKYYWKVIVHMISEETGYTIDQAHGKLAQKFLLVRDSGTPYARSTTSLSTKEMEDYLENIRRWAAEFLSLNIPEPGEV